jgi:DNA modification methylase
MMDVVELFKKRHPKNPNKHPDSQIERLSEIFKYQGIRHPIVVSKRSGLITKGHGRLAAAMKLHLEKFPVEFQKYESDEQEYADVVSDNSIASWADLDLAKINLEILDLGPDFDINMLGIKDFVIEPADKYGDKDADRIPESRNTDIKTSDLFQLGSHRLLCGDSTDMVDVERLMNGEKADMVYTDPPYGMNLDTDYSKMPVSPKQKALRPNSDWDGAMKIKRKPVHGDNTPFDPAHLFQIACDEMFLFGADYYAERLLDKNEGSWVVWDKRGNEQMDKGIGSCFELVWSKAHHKREIARITWCGVFGRDEGKAGHKSLHPTQKPVKLAEWFFERWGKDKTNIVDLYLGSGSTLIACEKTQRKCFGMEIDPQYCQVIIDRWEKFTGKKAEQIKEAKPILRKKHGKGR